MDEQYVVLQKKAEQVRKQLERWARKNNVLRPGQQIGFEMSIRDVPTVVSKVSKSILELFIPDFFTEERCNVLSISRRRRVAIIKRVYGNVKFGPWDDPKRHEIRTVGDLAKFSKSQIMMVRNLGETVFGEIEKALNSVGIQLPEFPEIDL